MAKSTKELLTLDLGDFLSMNRRELSKVVSTLSSAANKRVRRMEQQEIESPAYLKMKESGGYFGSKGKDLNELRAEYMRVSGFLRAKTSSLSGYKKVKSDMYKRLGMKKGETIPEEQLKAFWTAYNEAEPSLNQFIKGSEELQKIAYSVWSGNTEMNGNELENAIREILDEQKREDMKPDEIANLFPIK